MLLHRCLFTLSYSLGRRLGNSSGKGWLLLFEDTSCNHILEINFLEWHSKWAQPASTSFEIAWINTPRRAVVVGEPANSLSIVQRRLRICQAWTSLSKLLLSCLRAHRFSLIYRAHILITLSKYLPFYVFPLKTFLWEIAPLLLEKAFQRKFFFLLPKIQRIFPCLVFSGEK